MSTKSGCRSCSGTGLEPVISLGRLPLANALLDPGAPPGAERAYPLDVVFCPGCSLVQLAETVPREEIFRDYAYFSSYSDTMLAHCEGLAARVVQEERLTGRSLVLEVASNDGYLLQYFQRLGVPVLGIDPARNVAAAAAARGIRTVTEFFGPTLAGSLPQADVVVANNVLAHVDDLNGFVSSLRLVLKPGGVAILEVPYVREMVDRCEFDTVYHEHLCYFSVTALDALFRRNGLQLERVDRLKIHGGSLLVRARSEPRATDSVDQICREETAWGMRTRAYYRMMAHRMAGMRQSLLSLLSELKEQGARIVGYGAAAKGATLLNCFGIGRETLDFVADRSPHKHGRLIPGVRVPIVPAERLEAERPDYAILLAWNLADEIMASQSSYRAGGGKFITHIPELRVL